MPDPTALHRRTRSRADANVSSPEPQIPDSSPSRHPSKKRKLDETAQTSTVSEEELQVDSVIACLSMPNHEVMVAHDHANDKNAREHRDGVKAFAKLSGLNWTFYVKELRIVLGRPPDTRPAGGGSTDGDVDIDLGPSKLVSRQHAVIEYDTAGIRRWTLNVYGRNGVKVDDELYKRGSMVYLKSGNLLEVAGVQMLFFLPNQQPSFSPALLRRAHDNQASQDDYTDNNTNDNSRKRNSRVQSRLGVKSQLSPHTAKVSATFEPSDGNSENHDEDAIDQQSLHRIKEPLSSNSIISLEKPSAAYHRGLMLETTEDFDYSHDSAKEIKPPYSYATLIAQAILSSNDEKLTLSQIYSWIQEKYAFYRHAATGWQNSIRHNLSLNKAFQKIPRRTDEPGKGMKWKIADESRDDFTKKAQKASSKGGRVSQPSSPASDAKGSKLPSANSSAKTISSRDSQEGSRDSDLWKKGKMFGQRSVTPPPLNFNRVTPKEAFTPDRGSRNPISSRHAQGKTAMDESRNDEKLKGDADVMENRKSTDKGGNTPTSPGQIRVMSSPYIHESSSHSLSTTAITPAPQRQHPLLAPPSTTQLPSSYMPTSSPAPFWKYLNMSTPAKGDFSSPVKSPMLHSSSPPGPSGLIFPDSSSPTKDREIFGVGKKKTAKAVSITKNNDDFEDGIGDLEGVDLSKKNFEKIGTFHAQQAAHRAPIADSLKNERYGMDKRWD